MDRVTRAKEIVDDYLRRQCDGEQVDKDQLVATHAALMPELGEQFRKLQLIRQAQLQAQSADTNSSRAAGPLDSLGGSVPPQPAPDSFAGYKITRRIHRGGQGVVYQATQEATGREVAIKVLREGPLAGPHEHARFEREIQILATFNHPHIVTIHASGETAGHHFFVMDYIEGQPLDVFMAQRDRSVTETIELFRQICNAVQAAHLRGVIHRDLKPSNIRIDPDGAPHILDFGLAKLAIGPEAEDVSDRALTVTGQFVGSFPWAAPEQAEGAPQRIDLRTDVYSLGVILFQMLTSQFPYDIAGNASDVIRNIITATPAKPSSIRTEVGNEVETIVLKCLSKDPDRRYQSAGDLARDIERCLHGEAIEAKRDSTWYVFRKSLRRYRIPLAVAMSFVLLIAGFGVAMSVMYARATKEAATANRVQASLESIFTELGLGAASTDVTVRELLDRGAERAAGELAQEPEAKARLMHTIATTYLRLGLHEQAASWWSRIIELRRTVLRNDDVALATTHASLAQALEWTGYYAEADDHFRRALSTLRRVSPRPDREFVDVLIQYGGYRQNIGEYGRARELIVEALDIVRSSRPVDEQTIERTVFVYAGLLHDTGEYDHAERYYREALALARRNSWGNGGAEVFVRAHIGLLLKDRGEYGRAETLLHEVLAAKLRIFGQRSVPVAKGYFSLAKLYTDMNDLAAAEEPCRKAVELFTRLYGPQHRHTARPLTLLGQILTEQGRFQEAEPLLRTALEIRRERKPPGHWKTAKTESILGACLAGQSRFEEAEPLVVNSYPVISSDRGTRHRRTIEACGRIIELYDAWGKPQEAAAYRARLPIADQSGKTNLPTP